MPPDTRGITSAPDFGHQFGRRREIGLHNAGCATDVRDASASEKDNEAGSCKCMPPDLLELGSRFERARRPRLMPAPGTATRPRRKTTRFGTSGRVGERGGAPPAVRLRRASTAALPGFPAKSISPSSCTTLSRSTLVVKNRRGTGLVSFILQDHS